MTPEAATIDTLRRWSHLLLWVSILLPILGAALGALAAGARYYVERHEKGLSAQMTANAIQRANETAAESQRELAAFKARAAPRRIVNAQREALLPIFRGFSGRPVAVACRMMDGESCDFATELVGILREAGCAVPDLIRTSINDFPGYIVIAAHGEVPIDLLTTLDAAFKAAQVPSRVDAVKENSVGMWYPNTAHIIVGRKSP